MAIREVAITRISPMSAFRTAMSLSLVGLAAWVMCVVLLYFGLDSAGVWAKMNDIIGGIGGDQQIDFGLVLAVASLLGAIVAIIVSILAPLFAIIYNSIVDLFGGIKVRLRDETD